VKPVLKPILKPMMKPVLLSLGANLGEREHTLAAAVQHLCERVFEGVVGVSSLYETAPVGYTDQPPFMNLAVVGETRMPLEEVLRHCKAIEQELGRKPRPRWHERELDIDICLYADLVVKTEHVCVPHPQMHERAFVLAPACEIAAEMEHPEFHCSLQELWERFEKHEPNARFGIQRLSRTSWQSFNQVNQVNQARHILFTF